MRRLNRVELATARVLVARPVRHWRAPTYPALPEDVDAAVMRLGDRAARGDLDRASGWELAAELTWRVHQHRDAPGRAVPWRGWDLLRRVDATTEVHGVEVRVDALTPDGRGYRRGVRLRDRLRELGGP